MCDCDSDSDFDNELLAAADEAIALSEAVGGNACCRMKVPDVVIPGAESDLADENYGFPYEQPYSIQRSFMRQLFASLSTGQHAIFESPTGTGKSMSLICGAMTWLNNHRSSRKAECETVYASTSDEIKQIDDDENDDWLGEGFDRRRKLVVRRDGAKVVLDSFAKRDERRSRIVDQIRSRKVKSGLLADANRGSFGSKKRSTDADFDFDFDFDADGGENDEFVVDDYESDAEKKEPKDTPKLDDISKGDDEVERPLQILFCSRTHSQLAQFAAEFRKTKFAEGLSCVTLGSRKTFCVNEQVKKLQSLSLMNERCMELQKGGKQSKKADGSVKKAGKAKCPYFRIGPISEFAEEMEVENLDIEDVLKKSTAEKVCPYFVSRFAAKSADLVLMPYQLLLHKQSREACRIDLKGNVVIFDEAHNLLDAISSVHSCLLSASQISAAHAVTTAYQERYKSRLKAKNLLYIRQLVGFLAGLQKFLSKLPKNSSKVLTVFQLVSEAGIEHVNMFKLLRYLRKSELSRKLIGFSAAFLSSQDQPAQACPMPLVETLLSCLSFTLDDGRFLVTGCQDGSQNQLKYILLNPAAHFKEIADQSRCVILAGGTMQPLGELNAMLVSPDGSLPAFHSYDHVVPKSHIYPVIVSSGPSGSAMDFSFANRNSPELLCDVGNFLVAVCQKSFGGVVCFFPSYAYENMVFEFLGKRGFLKQLSGLEYSVFREPKTAGEADTVLAAYEKQIKETTPRGRGSVLFAVVGGKLSEGINFSDHLGRVVIMIGLPFPNTKSPELVARMKFMEKDPGSPSSDSFIEDLCMKSVNQSIGRVIRHRDDYAAILLLDSRYERNSIREKLPGWIRSSLKCGVPTGDVLDGLAGFFRCMLAESV